MGIKRAKSRDGCETQQTRAWAGFVAMNDQEKRERQLDLDESLRWAIHNMNTEDMQESIDKGADVESIYSSFPDLSVLNKCIEYGFPSGARLLIDNDADVNRSDVNGRTPLMHAISEKMLGVSELLIEKGARIEDLDKNGNSAAFYAVSGDSLKSLKLLKKYGADFDGKNSDGDTPITYACVFRYADLAISMINMGIDTDITLSTGISLLDYCRKEKLDSVAAAIEKAHLQDPKRVSNRRHEDGLGL